MEERESYAGPVTETFMRVVFRVEPTEWRGLKRVTGELQVLIPQERGDLFDKHDTEWLTIGRMRAHWCPEWISEVDDDLSGADVWLEQLDAESADLATMGVATIAYVDAAAKAGRYVMCRAWLGLEWVEIDEEWRGHRFSYFFMAEIFSTFRGLIVALVARENPRLVPYWEGFGLEHVFKNGHDLALLDEFGRMPPPIPTLVHDDSGLPPKGTWWYEHEDKGWSDMVKVFSDEGAPFCPVVEFTGKWPQKPEPEPKPESPSQWDLN